MRICINVKVFEWIFLPSSATNMVTQIIYLGRMEVGDWYYTVFFFCKSFVEWFLQRFGDCIMQFFCKYFFNRISSFWMDILT